MFATSKDDLTNIISYHAITGCDSVSDIAGHGNRSDGNAFCSNPNLLANRGKGDFMTKHIQVSREHHLRDVH